MNEEERQKVHKELKATYEHTFDMDNPQPVKHFWVDRGLVMSCEGGDHPNHRIFKRRK